MVELKTHEEFQTSSGGLSTVPILLLNIHENCNCRCLMCDIWKRPPGSELTLQKLTQYRESMRALSVKEVVLTGGEPLLHSQFEKLCDLLKECEVRITLLTTGLLLEKRAETVARYIDEVIVSLDGPESVHDSIRRVRSGFRLISAGVAAVRRYSSEIAIKARSTVQRANFLYLRETVAAARKIGFDSISFLAIDVSSQAFNRELIWPGERQNEVALTVGETAALEEEIELLIEQYRDEIANGFIVESPAKLRRIVRRFREHLGQFPPEAPICNAPWVSAVVEVDGTVRPCFFHDRVGSTESSTLKEAINSSRAQQFRRSLDVAQDSTCQRCVCSLNYKAS